MSSKNESKSSESAVKPPTVAPTQAFDVLKPTPISEIPKMVQSLRERFATQETKSLEWRRTQLKALLALIDEHNDELLAALYKDLKKNKNEATMFELNLVKSEIADHLNHLAEWLKPTKPSVGLINKMDQCQVRSEPLGVVLIIGAWNYPIQLTLLPLVGALSAGNCVVVKPSEVSEHTAQVLGELLPKYLDPKAVAVVNGAVAETQAVLAQKFDKILYTGNGAVARIILEAAAKHLTPCILELGGKSPAVVDRNCDIKVAARRIAWGKWMNCGQTCIAPDYVMCEKSIQNDLVRELEAASHEFFTKDPKSSNSYARIINGRHFNRIKGLMGAGTTVMGGEKECDEKDKYIPPTIITDIDDKAPVMKEEIFGPVLPIRTIENIDSAIQFINQHDKPLALYVFSNDDAVCERVLSSTSSGGAIANDTLMHAGVPQLPFGGVGASGMGAYHGKLSFDAFSHQRAVMVKKLGMEAVNGIRYPPYTDKKTSWISWLAVERVQTPLANARKFMFKAAVVAAAAAAVLRFFPGILGRK